MESAYLGEEMRREKRKYNFIRLSRANSVFDVGFNFVIGTGVFVDEPLDIGPDAFFS